MEYIIKLDERVVHKTDNIYDSMYVYNHYSNIYGVDRLLLETEGRPDFDINTIKEILFKED